MNYSSTINSSHAGAATLLPDHANDDDGDGDDDDDESSRVMIF